MERSSYRGRFAPSPTGPLHFGSLVAAVGSYLDAKHHGGTWLVRMEDLDRPRCLPGAADDILRTLASYGMISDEPVMYQSQRTPAYEDALRQLQTLGAIYPCGCTRREIADSALHGIEGFVYPGTCRDGLKHSRETLAWRVRTDRFPSPYTLPSSPFEFTDALQGHIAQHLETDIGDFVVKRADGLFAYQLAVVVDDASQRISHVVRGADLLDSTPRQIYLQRLLELPTPTYLHLPVAVNEQGEKLSKQTRAEPVGVCTANLYDALQFLRQSPPAELRHGTIDRVLSWGIAHWQPGKLAGCRQLPA